MRDDLYVLLTSTAFELTGRGDPELDRQLAWLRCWYGWARWPRPARDEVYRQHSRFR